MKIAVKITNKDQFYEVLKHDAIDTVYLGSEGCFYKLWDLHVLKDVFSRAGAANKEIFYATPVVQQRHLDEVKHHINTLMDWNIDYVNVVNDLGLLYYLGSRYPAGKLTIYLGRLLNRSIESCPWNDHIIRNESDFMKQVMKTNITNMQILVEYLSRFSVSGIEGNLTPCQTKSLTQLKQKGFRLMMNYDTIYVTSGRICTTAHYTKKAPPECVNECDEPIKVELSKIRDVFEIKESYFESPEAKELYGKMDILGNVVLRENNVTMDKINFDLYDGLIFDLRWYGNTNWESLLKRIETIKNDMVMSK